jgi:shikimate dehydrogenase
MREVLEAIETCVSNRLDASAHRAGRLAGIIGDRPSQYAKSPSLWNAVFRNLNLDCVYLPFDVDEPNLGSLVGMLRRTDRLLGFNVTVPYKVKIIGHLDGLDEKTRQIGAVNTVVRTEDGRLIGHNTDGSGFLSSLTTHLLRDEKPLLPDLKGVDALIAGAGGAARAVAFYLAEAIGSGQLVIANRTREAAAALADEVNRAYGNASGVGEDEIARVAPSAGLVVNCSTKGQSGIRRLSGGRVTILEPYSALASASPAVLPEGEAEQGAKFSRQWFEASLEDIERNNRVSAEVALRMPSSVAAYDLVYAPLETVFLRHCRLTGHRTANGKGMNIAQAVDALFDKVCRGYFRELGLDSPETCRRIVNVMCDIW